MIAADALSVSTVRHLLATLAYRASKVLRHVPEDFAEFAAAPAGTGRMRSPDFSKASARSTRNSGRIRAADLEKLMQGPLADALTHVGQLAMLRGMFGAPVRPEAYAQAGIARGQTGLERPPPVREFDGDASARK